jgi:hypothetical protein
LFPHRASQKRTTLAPGEGARVWRGYADGDRHGGTTPEHAFRSAPSLACPNLPVVSADNLNSFATISGSRKKVFILFLRGTVRAGMLPSKLPLGSGWEGREPSHPVAAWPIYLIALILDYVGVALGAASPLGSPATTGRDSPFVESASEKPVRDTRESRLD